MKPRIQLWCLATISTIVIAVAFVEFSVLLSPEYPPKHLRSETINNGRQEQTQIWSERWKPFTSDQLRTSLAKQRVAVIWIGYEFSFRTEVFEVILGPTVEGVDYYEHLVDWGNPKISPFYEERLIPKDGGIIIYAPKRERTFISLGDENLPNIRNIIRDLVLSSP